MATLPTAVDAEVAPALPALDAAAARRQRRAITLQALYLGVLLLAPLVRLLPLPVPGRSAIDDRLASALLLVAVVLRLGLRRVAADADWVEARRRAEEERAAAWRRAATGSPAPSDGPLVRWMAGLPAPERWALYRHHRIDGQIAYFARRGGLHGAAARRWALLRVGLTGATLALGAAGLVLPGLVAAWTTGVVSSVLAATEAWIQFRRSAVLASGYRDARAQLVVLRDRAPADDAELGAAVDAVELALERERWTWTAIMSVAVLTARRHGGPAPLASAR